MKECIVLKCFGTSSCEQTSLNSSSLLFAASLGLLSNRKANSTELKSSPGCPLLVSRVKLAVAPY